MAAIASVYEATRERRSRRRRADPCAPAASGLECSVRRQRGRCLARHLELHLVAALASRCRRRLDDSRDWLTEAAGLARRTDPAAIPAGIRQVFYYADTARALTRIGGRDREAIRFLLTAERIAPQHVRTATDLPEPIRTLLNRSRRQAGGTELRALCERMQTV